MYQLLEPCLKSTAIVHGWFAMPLTRVLPTTMTTCGWQPNEATDALRQPCCPLRRLPPVYGSWLRGSLSLQAPRSVLADPPPRDRGARGVFLPPRHHAEDTRAQGAARGVPAGQRSRRVRCSAGPASGLLRRLRRRCRSAGKQLDCALLAEHDREQQAAAHHLALRRRHALAGLQPAVLPTAWVEGSTKFCDRENHPTQHRYRCRNPLVYGSKRVEGLGWNR